ncbi:hypothetical protein ACFQ7G_03885 [Streptomyces massasporeus]
MSSDPRRELIPRNATIHLIDSLDALQSRLRSAAEQTHLLDGAGRVPTTPSYAELLQHAAEAQALSRDILQLTADFARSSHSTTRAGTAVLAHLATAATRSSHAAPAFAETAETALSLPRSAGPTDRQHSGRAVATDSPEPDHDRMETPEPPCTLATPTGPTTSSVRPITTTSWRRPPTAKPSRNMT